MFTTIFMTCLFFSHSLSCLSQLCLSTNLNLRGEWFRDSFTGPVMTDRPAFELPHQMTLGNMATLDLSPGLITEQFSHSQGIYFFLDFSSLCPAGIPGYHWLQLTHYLLGKIPWKRKWQPTPVFLLGKSHGQGTLAGYSPWGRRVRHKLVTKQQQLKVL